MITPASPPLPHLDPCPRLQTDCSHFNNQFQPQRSLSIVLLVLASHLGKLRFELLHLLSKLCILLFEGGLSFPEWRRELLRDDGVVSFELQHPLSQLENLGELIVRDPFRFEIQQVLGFTELRKREPIDALVISLRAHAVT